jgi:hypothetical protein
MYVFSFVIDTKKKFRGGNMTDRKLEDINNQIEKVRTQLNELAKEKPLSDPKIVETSQLLDELLNEYERLKDIKS